MAITAKRFHADLESVWHDSLMSAHSRGFVTMLEHVKEAKKGLSLKNNRVEIPVYRSGKLQRAKLLVLILPHSATKDTPEPIELVTGVF